MSPVQLMRGLHTEGRVGFCTVYTAPDDCTALQAFCCESAQRLMATVQRLMSMLQSRLKFVRMRKAIELEKGAAESKPRGVATRH